jgi:hypothetical protein
VVQPQVTGDDLESFSGYLCRELHLEDCYQCCRKLTFLILDYIASISATNTFSCNLNKIFSVSGLLIRCAIEVLEVALRKL